MDKDKIEMKTTMESAAVAEYLTALAKGFKTGIITVEKNGESLTMIPVDIAEVEVEARVKKDKARFSLEVTWRLPQEQDDAATSFSISAEAPKAAPAKPEQKCESKDEKKDDKKEDKKDDKKDVKKVEAPAASVPSVKPASPAGAAQVTVSVVKPAPASSPASDPKAGHKA